MLVKNQGISQNKISEELGCDKAMSARTITKLIQLGYLDRKKDEDDFRANKLYLTEKANVTIPKVLQEIHKLIDTITMDLSDEEKIITIHSLDKVLGSIKKIE